jgi:arsenite transporter/arsenate reductase (thioredoxin)
MDVHRVAMIAGAMSDPTRVSIMAMADGKLGVGQIATALNLSSPTVSHHVAVLAKVGLIAVERCGRRSVPVRVRDVGWLLARALD